MTSTCPQKETQSGAGTFSKGAQTIAQVGLVDIHMQKNELEPPTPHRTHVQKSAQDESKIAVSDN